MNKKTNTRVLLYNLSPKDMLPLTERILQERGMPFINVKNAGELFNIPAFLAIVDPDCFQGKFWSVEWFELGPCFERMNTFSPSPQWFIFTRPLTIPVPDVIQRRIIKQPECITVDFLQRVLDRTGGVGKVNFAYPS